MTNNHAQTKALTELSDSSLLELVINNDTERNLKNLATIEYSKRNKLSKEKNRNEDNKNINNLIKAIKDLKDTWLEKIIWLCLGVLATQVLVNIISSFLIHRLNLD